MTYSFSTPSMRACQPSPVDLTTFEDRGANGRLIAQLAGAFRGLEEIASAGVVREVLSGG